MKIRKLSRLVSCILLAIFLTGCWDKIEIDERAFVMAIGIDREEKMLKLTYAIPNLPVITGISSGGGEKNFIKQSTGKTIYDSTNDVRNKSSIPPNFDHTKVVVFGRDFLEKGKQLKEVLDYFDRSTELALSLLVITTDQSAQELIEMEVNSALAMGMYTYQFFNNEVPGDRAFDKNEMKEFIVDILATNGNARLPIMVSEGKELVFKGISYIKDYQLVYSINEVQAKMYSWLLGKGVGTVVDIEVEDNIIPYTITQINRRIEFEKKNNELNIKVIVETEGDISEYYLKKGQTAFDNKKILELQKKIESKMEEDMVEIISLAQKQIGFDVLELEEQLKIKEGKLYEEIKENWIQYFTSANIQVESLVNIRRIGMSK